MPVFHFRALAASGQIVEGRMEAPDKGHVLERLREQGHFPLRADADAPPRKIALFRTGSRTLNRELAAATRELATLLQAGVPLDRAIEILIGLAAGARMGRAMADLLDRIRGGETLSAAMAARPEIFPPFYIGMVRAGEAGGTIETVLAALADHMQRSLTMTEAVRTAMIYPIILLLVAASTIWVMLALVLPQFKTLFEDAGHSLPFAARLVSDLGDIAHDHGWWLLLAALGCGLWLRGWVRTPTGRLAFDRLVLRLPVVGSLVARHAAARLARGLASLIANGVPHLAAVAIVKDTLGNTVIRRGMDSVAAGLKEGRGLANPLAAIKVVPRLAVDLIRVGEESGRLETMLGVVADVYEQEVQRTLMRLLALLVPAMTLVLALIVSAIVGAILAAIMSIYDLPF